MPAIGRSSDVRKNYSKSNTTKKSESSQRGTVTARARGGVKKKYVPKFSDAKAKAKKALTSDKAYTWKFGDAFKNAKKEGKKVFTWNNKKYTTQTKAELEAGKSEKERFERAAKSKKVPNNQSNWNKFKDSKTLAEFFGKLKKKDEKLKSYDMFKGKKIS